MRIRLKECPPRRVGNPSLEFRLARRTATIANQFRRHLTEGVRLNGGGKRSPVLPTACPIAKSHRRLGLVADSRVGARALGSDRDGEPHARTYRQTLSPRLAMFAPSFRGQSVGEHAKTLRRASFVRGHSLFHGTAVGVKSVRTI